jgi:hypothetical protein
MLLFLPFRLLRLALVGPRVLTRVMLHSPFRSLRLAIVLLCIAAVVTYFARNRRAAPRA